MTSAWNHSTIDRFIKHKNFDGLKIPGKFLQLKDQVQKLLQPQSNYASYREKIAHFDPSVFFLPIWHLVYTDMTVWHHDHILQLFQLIWEGNPHVSNSELNRGKLALISECSTSVENCIKHTKKPKKETGNGNELDAKIKQEIFELVMMIVFAKPGVMGFMLANQVKKFG